MEQADRILVHGVRSDSLFSVPGYDFQQRMSRHDLGDAAED